MFNQIQSFNQLDASSLGCSKGPQAHSRPVEKKHTLSPPLTRHTQAPIPTPFLSSALFSYTQRKHLFAFPLQPYTKMSPLSLARDSVPKLSRNQKRCSTSVSDALHQSPKPTLFSPSSDTLNLHTFQAKKKAIFA